MDLTASPKYAKLVQPVSNKSIQSHVHIRLRRLKIMFITSDELERRCQAENNLILRLEIPASDPPEIKATVDRKRFAKDGTITEQPVYTTGERILIGTATKMVGPTQAAEIFGINKSLAGALASEDYDKTKDADQVRSGIYAALESIRESARVKLELALGLINEETLQAIADKDKARSAAQIANQLSAIVDRTIEKAGLHVDNSKTAHLHLYSPEIRTMDRFAIKKVNSPLPHNGQSDAESLSE
jgi:hypothetical protein